jgi:RimJ/RimL family protein N-acetyltransferase
MDPTLPYFSISTSRLRFRPLNWGDLPAWEQFFLQNPHPEYLARTMAGPEDAKPLAVDWIQVQLARYAESGLGHLAAERADTGEFIGQAGILRKELDGQVVHEIAYSVMPAHWRQGYASEMAQRMKAFAQEYRVDTDVISIIHPDNIGSQRVAIGNGMSLRRHTVYQGMPACIFGVSLS